MFFAPVHLFVCWLFNQNTATFDFHESRWKDETWAEKDPQKFWAWTWKKGGGASNISSLSLTVSIVWHFRQISMGMIHGSWWKKNIISDIYACAVWCGKIGFKETVGRGVQYTVGHSSLARREIFYQTRLWWWWCHRFCIWNIIFSIFRHPVLKIDTINNITWKQKQKLIMSHITFVTLHLQYWTFGSYFQISKSIIHSQKNFIAFLGAAAIKETERRLVT